MAGRTATGLVAALLLGACAQGPAVRAPLPADLSAEAIATTGATPPPGPAGACWAFEQQPAVYETVTEQTLLSPEQRDKDGNVVAPASYRSVSRLSILSEARDVAFRSPCPEELTLPFIASLQRALKARGYYLAPVTGSFDAATAQALRRYQAEHGLDSAQISLKAAQDLGLSLTAISEL